MKKKAIVLLAFTAALTAVSCQKEAMKEAETTLTGEGMTISAVSEGIGVAAKADLAYKYDVIWRKLDRICVKNSDKSVEFTLTDGEGTTKGTFSSGESISGEVEGFYPASVANLIWPAEQQNNHVPPMYCKKTLSSTQNQTFNFASLGSVLQLNFNSTTADIVLKSIEVKADEAMSGAFTVEDGQAKVSQPEGDKPGITLDLGEGVALGTSAKKFNLAVPAGEYNNLTITFIAKDGRKCIIHATKVQTIAYNTVNTLAISGGFKFYGALPGVFTVSNDGGMTKTQIYFSQGNLWYGKVGDAQTATFNFEANQYDTTPTSNGGWDASHVSHFYWSKDARVAYSENYNNANTTYGITPDQKDVFFTNETVTTAKAGFTVNVNGKEQSGWRTLSTAEWQYLFNTRSSSKVGETENARYAKATVNGKAGIILLPDTYSHPTGVTALTYINQVSPEFKINIYDLAAWNKMEVAGAVFLPAAGDRNGSVVLGVGDSGDYWSSTAYDKNYAYSVFFNSSLVYPNEAGFRDGGYSVRLITESK